MKKLNTVIFFILSLVVGGILKGQVNKLKNHENHQITKRTCATNEHHEFMKRTNPDYEKNLLQYNKQLESYLKNKNQQVLRSTASINIPVVVHVVYKNAAENISDQRVIEQINVLNQDFQRKNADTVNTPSIFKPVAKGTKISFCLATRDPQGKPTNGIVRKATTEDSFNTNDNVKKSAKGGDDPWDVTKYVNIWICDLGTDLLGYAEFPTTAISNTYGLVLHYKHTGITGAEAPFNKGRTGTHEFGHCFNLFHIWGDDNGECTGSDEVDDTPNQKGENYNTPSFPQGPTSTGGCCNAADKSSMFMNYMDYTDDAAMCMFTAKQIDRIEAVINTAPWNILQSSNGCVPVNLLNNDAGLDKIESPIGVVCSNTINPVLVLKNFGQNNLTSCSIIYKIDNGSIASYNWTGDLASYATTTIHLPQLNVSNGSHVFTVFTSSPNGVTDLNTSNDQLTTEFNVLSTGIQLPYSEGFENTPFPSAQNITINNADAGITWATTSTAAFTGSKSVFMDNWNYSNGSGQKDEMVLPALDLSSASSPVLNFQVAYTYFTTSGTPYSDTLEILASKDCGLTYTTIYKKWRNDLKTAPPVSSQANSFVPSNSSQWRRETVDLSTFKNENYLMLKFRSISDYEDNLYIDDIVVSPTVDINTISVENMILNLYPNPSNGKIKLEIYNNVNVDAPTLVLFNTMGQEIIQMDGLKGISSTQEFDFSSLSSGVYHLQVKWNNFSLFRKIIINRE